MCIRVYISVALSMLTFIFYLHTEVHQCLAIGPVHHGNDAYFHRFLFLMTTQLVLSMQMLYLQLICRPVSLSLL